MMKFGYKLNYNTTESFSFSTNSIDTKLNILIIRFSDKNTEEHQMPAKLKN